MKGSSQVRPLTAYERNPRDRTTQSTTLLHTRSFNRNSATAIPKPVNGMGMGTA